MATWLWHDQKQSLLFTRKQLWVVLWISKRHLTVFGGTCCYTAEELGILEVIIWLYDHIVHMVAWLEDGHTFDKNE